MHGDGTCVVSFVLPFRLLVQPLTPTPTTVVTTKWFPKNTRRMSGHENHHGSKRTFRDPSFCCHWYLIPTFPTIHYAHGKKKPELHPLKKMRDIYPPTHQVYKQMAMTQNDLDPRMEYSVHNVWLLLVPPLRGISAIWRYWIQQGGATQLVGHSWTICSIVFPLYISENISLS